MAPARGTPRKDRGLFGPDTIAWKVIGYVRAGRHSARARAA
jgi:uncharacterized protein (DUF2236 family)